MLRTLCIAMLSALALVACKTDKPNPEASARPTAATGPISRPEPRLPVPAEPAKPPERPAEVKPVEPPSKPAAPRDPELETKGLAMMEKLADLFVADASDCERLAGDLKNFVGQNKALLTQLASGDSEDDDQRAAFAKRHGAAQAAIAKKMQSAMAACAGHPSVLAAMQEFPGE